MLHCLEPWRWNLLLSVITAVLLNSWSAAKSHEIIFNSFTSSPTAAQVRASEAKVSRALPLFPVTREKNCCRHHIFLLFPPSCHWGTLCNETSHVHRFSRNYDSFSLHNRVWEKLYSRKSKPVWDEAQVQINALYDVLERAILCVVSLIWAVLALPRRPRRGRQLLWLYVDSAFIKSSTNVSGWKSCYKCVFIRWTER